MIDEDEPRPTIISKRGLTRALWAVAVLLLVVGAAAVNRHYFLGVFVVITNQQSAPITDVVLYVTGQSIQVGHIDAGESRRVKVSPTGDTHLEFEFKDIASKASGRLSHDYYFGPGFYGQIELDIGDGSIGMRDDLRIGDY